MHWLAHSTPLIRATRKWPVYGCPTDPKHTVRATSRKGLKKLRHSKMYSDTLQLQSWGTWRESWSSFKRPSQDLPRSRLCCLMPHVKAAWIQFVCFAVCNKEKINWNQFLPYLPRCTNINIQAGKVSLSDNCHVQQCKMALQQAQQQQHQRWQQHGSIRFVSFHFVWFGLAWFGTVHWYLTTCTCLISMPFLRNNFKCEKSFPISLAAAARNVEKCAWNRKLSANAWRNLDLKQKPQKNKKKTKQSCPK